MATPLEYVTEWRMQKAMPLLQQRDKKLIDVARSVGYESDAAFSKAFKRVVGTSPGEYLKRGFQDRGHAGTAEDFWVISPRLDCCIQGNALIDRLRI
jgi:AraC-like DNA-binding protein